MIVFGGSFDPPQVAHVTLPEIARQQVGAEVIAYIPAAVSPLKAEQQSVAAEHRLAMLRLALADRPHAIILTDELDRAGDGQPSYTIQTLEHLRSRLGENTELRLLIGTDQLAVFDRWREPARIEQLAEPLVMVRPPTTRESVLDALPKGYDRDTWRRRLVDGPAMAVSSTEVRRRLAAGESVRGLIDPEVEAYIRAHHLYGVAEG